MRLVLNPGLFLPALCFLLFSCSPKPLPFDLEDIQTGLRKELPVLLNIKGSGDSIHTVHIYEARIREQLVARNANAEYRLMNVHSRIPREKNQMIGYYHRLFLFQFTGAGHDFIVYVAASFDASDKCLRIGPNYAGERYSGENTALLYRVKAVRAREKLRFVRKEPVALQLESNLPFQGIRGVPIRITRILQTAPNKISGANGLLIFDVPEIFNDPDFLTFELVAR